MGLACEVLLDPTPACASGLTSSLSAASSLCSRHAELQAMSSPAFAFVSALPGISYHRHPILQSLKRPGSSRTQVIDPQHPIWVGNSCSGLPSLQVCLCGHLHITHDAWHLAAFVDARMLAPMPSLSQVMCFQGRSLQYKLTSTQWPFFHRDKFFLIPNGKPRGGRYWAFVQAPRYLSGQ